MKTKKVEQYGDGKSYEFKEGIGCERKKTKMVEMWVRIGLTKTNEPKRFNIVKENLV